MIVAVMRVQANYLVTSDLRSVKHFPVVALALEDALRVLEAQS